MSSVKCVVLLIWAMIAFLAFAAIYEILRAANELSTTKNVVKRDELRSEIIMYTFLLLFAIAVLVIALV